MGSIGEEFVGNCDNGAEDYVAVSSSEESNVDGECGKPAIHSTRTWVPSPNSVFNPYIMDSPVLENHYLQKERPVVIKLTVDLKKTYKACNPNFSYAEIVPSQAFTNPSVGVSNDGLDNANSDLILSNLGVLVNSESGCRYVVQDMLGQGTFGQVAKCLVDGSADIVAVKVIKNQPAYFHQAQVEINILKLLNETYDQDDKHHIVRLLDHFVFQNHLCIVFELLNTNVFELIKKNHFRGLSLNLVRLFTKQLLESLCVLRDAKVIHCDLKPENILLKGYEGDIKLIDFGSACMEDRTVYSYIQSRFYRSPEVLLGHAYTPAIDMWSLGCVAAECFLGLPLFPGASEFDLLQCMVETLGEQPPDHMLIKAKQVRRFFKRSQGVTSGLLLGESSSKGASKSATSSYTLLTEEEFELNEKTKPARGKRYFKSTRLEDVIMEHARRRDSTGMENSKEKEDRMAFVDFLRGLVQLDPLKRWTPHQAVLHPFIREQPLTGPFCPAPETVEKVSGPPQDAEIVSPAGASGTGDSARLSHNIRQQQQQQQHLYHHQQQQLSGSQLAGMARTLQHGSYGTSYGSYGSFGSNGEVPASFSDAPAGYSTYATPPGPLGLHSRRPLPNGAVSLPPHSAGLVAGAAVSPAEPTFQIPIATGSAADGTWYSGQLQVGLSPMNGAGSVARSAALGQSPSSYLSPPGAQHPYKSSGPSSARGGWESSGRKASSSPHQYAPPSPLRTPIGTGLGPGKSMAAGYYNKGRRGGGGRGPTGYPGGSAGSLAAGSVGDGGGQLYYAPHPPLQPRGHQSSSASGASTLGADSLGAGLAEGPGRHANSTGSGASPQGHMLDGTPRRHRPGSFTLDGLPPMHGHGVQYQAAHSGSSWGAAPAVVQAAAAAAAAASALQLAGGNQTSGGAGPAEAISDFGDDSSSPPPPDPADWDPYYTDDDLLQDDRGPTGASAGASSGSAGGFARHGPGPGGSKPSTGVHRSQKGIEPHPGRRHYQGEPPGGAMMAYSPNGTPWPRSLGDGQATQGTEYGASPPSSHTFGFAGPYPPQFSPGTNMGMYASPAVQPAAQFISQTAPYLSFPHHQQQPQQMVLLLPQQWQPQPQPQPQQFYRQHHGQQFQMDDGFGHPHRQLSSSYQHPDTFLLHPPQPLHHQHSMPVPQQPGSFIQPQPHSLYHQSSLPTTFTSVGSAPVGQGAGVGGGGRGGMVGQGLASNGRFSSKVQPRLPQKAGPPLTWQA